MKMPEYEDTSVWIDSYVEPVLYIRTFIIGSGADFEIRSGTQRNPNVVPVEVTEEELNWAYGYNDKIDHLEWVSRLDKKSGIGNLDILKDD